MIRLVAESRPVKVGENGENHAIAFRDFSSPLEHSNVQGEAPAQEAAIEFDTSITVPADIVRAALALREMAERFGNFRVAACANIASKALMEDATGAVLASTIFGWPEAKDQWWKKPLIGLTSPLPQACRYEGDPFWANKYGIHTRVSNPHLSHLDLTYFSDLVNAPSAIVVPVHLPFGQIGAVSFSPKDLDREDISEEFWLYSDMFEAHARRFIGDYSRVTSKRPYIPENCRLSQREVECLSWAAVGKTDAEIALILQRSCATVRFHLYNAATKLDAVNRSQAVFKATQLGFMGSVATISCSGRANSNTVLQLAG